METITCSRPMVLDDPQRRFESALVQERKKLGQPHPMFINGHATKARTRFTDVSPADTRVVIGDFQSGTQEHVRQAIAAARVAFPYWCELGWEQRTAFVRKAVELMKRHRTELAALVCLEVGKTRAEAATEVGQAIELLLHYCRQMEEQNGYDSAESFPGNGPVHSVLKPYGVWGVVTPFNFPLALAASVVGAAMLAGNTVVFKPASDAPFTGLRLYEMFHHAGLPIGVFNLVTGPGAEVGPALAAEPGIDGLVFSGSCATGLHLMQQFRKKTVRPCLLELSGKNAAIVMPFADLDDAAEGVARSAFGMSGQKCCACSRVYVHEQVSKPFLDLLVDKTRKLHVGNPADRDTSVGPLINADAVARFQRAVRLGKRDGRIVCGGNRLRNEPLAHGYFVEPTIIEHAPVESPLFHEEFFAPVVSMAAVKSLDQAIDLANGCDYGLAAGIFTRIEDEQRRFFERIHASVACCNRRDGATSDAWFGGWKNSGSTGRSSAGPHFLPQFMREQSQVQGAHTD